MKPHPRIRKTIKWGGAMVTVLLVVVWIGSGWWTVEFVNSRDCRHTVGLWGGQLFLSTGEEIITTTGQEGFSLGPAGRWRFWNRSKWRVDSLTQYEIEFPFVLVVSFTAFAAAVPWGLDVFGRRRDRLNLCPKCNYDRAGLAAGVRCPECGSLPS